MDHRNLGRMLFLTPIIFCVVGCSAPHNIDEKIVLLKNYHSKISAVALLTTKPSNPMLQDCNAQILHSFEEAFKKEHLPLAVFPASTVGITTAEQKFAPSVIKFTADPDYEDIDLPIGETFKPSHLMYLTVTEASWIRTTYMLKQNSRQRLGEEKSDDALNGCTYQINVVDAMSQRIVYKYDAKIDDGNSDTLAKSAGWKFLERIKVDQLY
jgi:hypothetical protein